MNVFPAGLREIAKKFDPSRRRARRSKAARAAAVMGRQLRVELV
jgi:hypothetical protein